MVDFLQVMHFDISPIYFSLSSKQNACCFVNRIYKLDSGYVTKKVGHWLPFFFLVSEIRKYPWILFLYFGNHSIGNWQNTKLNEQRVLKKPCAFIYSLSLLYF